jgi:hypothetical protein
MDTRAKQFAGRSERNLLSGLGVGPQTGGNRHAKVFTWITYDGRSFGHHFGVRSGISNASRG